MPLSFMAVKFFHRDCLLPSAACLLPYHNRSNASRLAIALQHPGKSSAIAPTV
ncbi:MAG TPA: hypothetical protein V6C85_25720 [Allocoleopsis sp.]